MMISMHMSILCLLAGPGIGKGFQAFPIRYGIGPHRKPHNDLAITAVKGLKNQGHISRISSFDEVPLVMAV
jgi:hypothetical protein